MSLQQYNKVTQPKKLNCKLQNFVIPNFYSESAILYSHILEFIRPSRVNGTWRNTEGRKLKSSGANHSFQFLCWCSKVPHTLLFLFWNIRRRVRQGVFSILGACRFSLSLVLSAHQHGICNFCSGTQTITFSPKIFRQLVKTTGGERSCILTQSNEGKNVSRQLWN